MSDTDSFIDEVNEEVRRDRLYHIARRYGWIAIAAVLLIVGGAAFNEYRKAQSARQAQALGDALLDAVQQPEEERAAAIAAVDAPESASILIALAEAGALQATGDLAGSGAILSPLAADPDLSPVYADLAALRLILMGPEAGLDETTRAQLLERIVAPGAPYRLLGLEQQIVDLAVAGQADEARAAAESLLQEPGLSQALLSRVSQVMLTLGPVNGSE